jgi:hypothetical protein
MHAIDIINNSYQKQLLDACADPRKVVIQGAVGAAFRRYLWLDAEGRPAQVYERR